MKELVTLRKKPMREGQSLYLDYSINGVRRKEYLKMYLVAEKTKLDKIQNQETLKAAMTIKAQRIIELQNGMAGIKPKRQRKLFSDYIDEKVAEYESRGSHSRAEGYAKVKKFVGKLYLDEIDGAWLREFSRSLQRTGKYSVNTCYTYFFTIVTLLSAAVREDLLDVNPASKLARKEKPGTEEVKREFLTLDEVKKLMETPCQSLVKNMFLVSCFTGLRLIDLETLTWEEIKQDENGMMVEKVQVKTKKMVQVPLTENAIAWLPKRNPYMKNVFRAFNRNALGEVLATWVKRAGINKHITFHCARHTYATLLITYGADIYTVSRLLGHSNVNTTQIYAKVVDKKKREAAELIPQIG